MTRGRRPQDGLDDDIRDHIERETQENPRWNAFLHR